jgi:hypothetical protein
MLVGRDGGALHGALSFSFSDSALTPGLSAQLAVHLVAGAAERRDAVRVRVCASLPKALTRC